VVAPIARDQAPATTPTPTPTSTPRHDDASAPPAAPSALWSQILSSDAKRSLKTFLTKLNPISLTAGLAILEVPADLMEIARTNQREVEQLIASISGKRTTVEYRELGVTRSGPTAPAPGFEAAAPPAAAITDHPVIKRAAELLNARVISVQPRRRTPAPTPAPAASPTIPSATGDESGGEPEPISGDSD
jgi:hypothetical protein